MKHLQSNNILMQTHFDSENNLTDKEWKLLRSTTYGKVFINSSTHPEAFSELIQDLRDKIQNSKQRMKSIGGFRQSAFNLP